MAATLSPFGMRPINLIGGQAFSGGTVREYLLPSNVALAYYTGALMKLDTNGVITPWSSTAPVAPVWTGTATAGSAGIVGICAGVRYVSIDTKQPLHAQYLPTGAVTAGYTDVWIKVWDDPDQLYTIQCDTAVGSKTNGARGAIGQNVQMKTFTGSATTGLSNMVADTGSNWGSTASTATLPLRIVDIATPNDTYPELIVKFNLGVHSYYNSLAI